MQPAITEQQDSSPVRGGALASAREIVGAALLAAWYYIMYFSMVVHYSTRNDITHLNSTFAFACCGMIASFVYFAIRRQRHDLEVATPALPTWACAATMLVGTIVHHIIELDYFEQPWCSITSIIEGMAFAYLTLGWAHRFIDTDARPMAACLGAVFVLAAVAYVSVISLPSPANVFVTAVLPLVSAAVLGGLPRRKELQSADDVQPTVHLRTAAGEAIDNSYVIRALTAVGLISIANELMRAVFIRIHPTDDPLLYGLMLLAATLFAAVIAIVLNRCFRGRHSADLVSRVSAMLFMGAFLVALSARDQWWVSDFSVKTANAFATILTLIILAQATNAYGLSVDQSFGFGMGITVAGKLIGHFLGSLLASFSTPSAMELELVAGIGIAMTTASLLFHASGDVLARLTDCDDERPVAPRRFGLRCQAVAERYGLSPKETEVMILAAKGRTNDRIQQAMGISTGTVNTYFARLYRKLDVHDRQEMLDIIERQG